MAKPIEATEPLCWEDWQRLLADLKNMCSPEEAERRTQQAHKYLEEMRRDKGCVIVKAGK